MDHKIEKKENYLKIQIPQVALLFFLNRCYNLLSTQKYIFSAKIGSGSKFKGINPFLMNMFIS